MEDKDPTSTGRMGEEVESGNDSSACTSGFDMCCLYHWKPAKACASEGPADMKASLYIASGEGLWLLAWALMTRIFHLCLTVAQRNCGINRTPMFTMKWF